MHINIARRVIKRVQIEQSDMLVPQKILLAQYADVDT